MRSPDQKEPSGGAALGPSPAEPVASRPEPVPPAAGTRPPRLHEIDGLRALAVGLVVFHHSITSALVETPRPGSAGSLFSATTTSGVDLFFVLSGVLLLRPYLRRERRFDRKLYLRRRIERLWPPYLVTLAFAGLVMIILTAHPTWYSQDVLPRFTVGDWLRQVGILNFGWTTYSGAWWSLTIEVLFYLAVPVVLAVVLACHTRRRRVLAASLLAAAVIAAIVTAAPGSAAVRDLASVFAPCFVMGALLARYSPSAAAGKAMIAAGVLYVLVANRFPHADIHLGFAILYGGLIALSLASQPVGRLLSHPLAVWLGERSYSLFLVHFPVFYLTNWLASLVVPSRTVPYFLLSRGVGIPLALAAAMAVFWIVERRWARGLATAGSFWPTTRLDPAPTPAGDTRRSVAG